MAASSALLGVTALSQIGSTFSQSQALRAQQAQRQSQLEFNKAVAEFQAEEARRIAERDVEVLEKRSKQVIGAQRAAFAAQGIDVEQGSALDVQLDTAAITEVDALTIRNNAARQAFGFKVDALTAASQRRFSDINFEAQRKSTLLTGGLGLLQTGARAIPGSTPQPTQSGGGFQVQGLDARLGSGQQFRVKT